MSQSSEAPTDPRVTGDRSESSPVPRAPKSGKTELQLAPFA